ncbi:8-oxo-dGTP diphosphatase [Alkalispirochaeta americana]|uniref:Oxidized purine nucleoside triphosphate hydrolase n=1 Tax=Alkalispirochaeta americana TaxID=159291 RepID=A0A1N6UIQ5_9SPIO|nr:8-oxo-dGTP diphosphatase [Alkalispirochaeta americana]SIQ65417.1 8-oxo-dGTP diphosphatase [Alkalispirochaeta americana]
MKRASLETSFPRSLAKSATSSPLDWSSYRPDDTAVLCFLRKPGWLLLIRKKRGLGAGKINGPGGKTEPGETPRDTAIRETREEVGLIPSEPRHQGALRFAFADGYRLEVHIFTATSWEGSLCETDEALPFWCPQEEIPYTEMWEDDILWLPAVLEGKSVEGEMFLRGDSLEFWDLRCSDDHQVG